MSDMAPQVINTYVRMKSAYASDILIEVQVMAVSQQNMLAAIHTANEDTTIHGIIVQLPLDDPSQTDEICNSIVPHKDVDGLGESATFPSATAEAIDWLLAGYNVELRAKRITLLGHGRLVGAPLAKMWTARELNVTVFDDKNSTSDIHEALLQSDIIVSATGVPRILTADNVPTGAVVVDAGTASEGGVILGDVDESVRARNDVTITPAKGGVGPLTYTLLFDHLIQAALKTIEKT